MEGPDVLFAHAQADKTLLLHSEWPSPQILAETARFVRVNGGQVEVLLRVKQANNPAFSFLSPSHPMHAYYRWVIETNPQV